MTTTTKETKETIVFTPPALQTKKSIETAIEVIRAKGKEYQADLHSVAVQCLMHFEKHGDLSLANTLTNGALPKSIRRAALVYWFAANSPCLYLDNDKFVTEKNRDEATPLTSTWKRKLCKDKSDTAAEFDIQNAVQVPFFILTAQTEPKTMDIDSVCKSVETLVKKIKKAVKDEAFNGDKKDLVALASNLDNLVPSAEVE